MRPETPAFHAGGEADALTGAVTPPLHLATTFRHGPDGERVAGYEYQREGNRPTTTCWPRCARWKSVHAH